MRDILLIVYNRLFVSIYGNDQADDGLLIDDRPPSQQTTTRPVVVCIHGLSQRATTMDIHESIIYTRYTVRDVDLLLDLA